VNQFTTRRRFITSALTSAGALALTRFASAQLLSNSATPKPIKIAFITDTHTTRGLKADQVKYAIYLKQIIAEINAAKPDWVLHGGDLTESASSEEISDFLEQIKALDAPIDWVYGNRDVGRKRVVGHFDAPDTAQIERIEAALGASFWEKTRAGVRVIGVNTSLFGSGLPLEAAQWDFLEAALQKPSATPTLYLGHYPAFIKTSAEEESPYWNLAPAPRARLLSLLEKGGVKAMLSGHIHRPLKLSYNDISFLVGPAVSYGLPRKTQQVGWTELTITPQGQIHSALRYIET
jgi:3',5'-cyclic AMP phosphodiesterase CpdA